MLFKNKFKYVYDVNKENNEVGLKFKVGDNFRISKYKTNFAKDYFSNWFKEFFLIKKVKSTCPGYML